MRAPLSKPEMVKGECSLCAYRWSARSLEQAERAFMDHIAYAHATPADDAKGNR